MRYVAAYLLATLGGQNKPTAADVERILSSVGIESEADKVKTVIKELSGKNLEELIAEGQKKLATVPSGGGGAPAAAAAPDAAAAGGDAKKAEPAKKEESDAESDEDMGFGLFD